MKNISQQILSAVSDGRKILAVLIDPEKCFGAKLLVFIDELNRSRPDFIFVGGSQLTNSVDDVVCKLKSKTTIPVVLFPGNAMQFSPNSDALLLLSLISGRNPDFLIGQHVKVAGALRESQVEVIPTGYILVDGGVSSAVSRVSGTNPIPQNQTSLLQDTAFAGELLGNKLIYLEAGSGAKKCVSEDLIRSVKSTVSIPLIVGGGIREAFQLSQIYHAGADIAVVGNILEEFPERLSDFVSVKNRLF